MNNYTNRLQRDIEHERRFCSFNKTLKEQLDRLAIESLIKMVKSIAELPNELLQAGGLCKIYTPSSTQEGEDNYPKPLVDFLLNTYGLLITNDEANTILRKTAEVKNILSELRKEGKTDKGWVALFKDESEFVAYQKWRGHRLCVGEDVRKENEILKVIIRQAMFDSWVAALERIEYMRVGGLLAPPDKFNFIDPYIESLSTIPSTENKEEIFPKINEEAFKNLISDRPSEWKEKALERRRKLLSGIDNEEETCIHPPENVTRIPMTGYHCNTCGVDFKLEEKNTSVTEECDHSKLSATDGNPICSICEKSFPSKPSTIPVVDKDTEIDILESMSWAWNQKDSLQQCVKVAIDYVHRIRKDKKCDCVVDYEREAEELYPETNIPYFLPSFIKERAAHIRARQMSSPSDTDIEKIKTEYYLKGWKAYGESL